MILHFLIHYFRLGGIKLINVILPTVRRDELCIALNRYHISISDHACFGVSTPSDQKPLQTSYEIYANHRSTLPVGIISYHIIMQPSPPKMPNRNFMHPERLPGAKLNAPGMS